MVKRRASNVTVTDLFCGAGGSSLGAVAAGAELVMAANHWRRAIEVHNTNFPDAAHDCADISQVDPRRYPRTDVLIASPECTNHTTAKGVSRKLQQPSLFEGPDPSAERSRATMFDVLRFIEVHAYDFVIVENVVDVTRWVFFDAWLLALQAAGYRWRILSINSMHTAEVPQSRDRVYVVAWPKGNRAPDLDVRPPSWCPTCEAWVEGRQVWKPKRSIGRWGSQYLYRCEHGHEVAPGVLPAAVAIDWALPGERIGDRARPLAEATRRRIRIGLDRYGYGAVVQGAGNTYEHGAYVRTWPLTDPLRTQSTTIEHGFVVSPNHTGADGTRVRGTEMPLPTQTASDDRQAVVTPPFIALLRGGGSKDATQPVDDPLSTVTASGNHHGLVCPPFMLNQMAPNDGDDRRVRSIDEPLATIVAAGNHAAVVRPPAFYVKNYGPGDDPSMTHPVSDPFGTITTQDHHALLIPYYRSGTARPTGEPMSTVTTVDRQALVNPAVDVDDCAFRMLEPHEVGAAMAFPTSYQVDGNKRERVRLYGNAVTPPVMSLIVGRCLEALG